MRFLKALAVAVAALGLVLGGTSAAQASSGIRELTGAKKQAFFRDLGWTEPLRCQAVGVAKSNKRWAISSATGKCGPHGGHNYVYKKNKKGKWKYLFYDMQIDGCDRFRMPSSVRQDFYPYVC